MIDETDPIRVLHDAYCRMARCQLTLTMDRLYYWSDFKAKGFTVDDLSLVIRYLDSEIRTGRRFEGSKKFSNLIQRLDMFEEELSLANGWSSRISKKAVNTARNRVLQQFSPVVGGQPLKGNVRSVAEVIAAMRQAAQ